MSLDRATIDRIRGLQDPLGIVSIYLDASPEVESRTTRSTETALRQELSRLEEQVREEGTRTRWKALHDRLERSGGALDRLVDLRGSGRGRALFLPVSDGEAIEVTSGIPFETRVAIEDSALLHPLLEAASLDPPTGIVSVAKGGIRVFDRHGGEIAELEDERFSQRADDMGNETGSPRSDAGYSGSAGKSIPQQDYYDRAVAEEQRNFVRSAAAHLGGLIGEHGWTRLVVAGDDRLTRILEEHLPSPARVPVVHVARGLDWQTPNELWTAVAEEVEAARRGADVEILQRAQDGALSTNGRGALGLADTLNALNDGRVETLVLERGLSLAGVTAPDGRLAPEGEVPLGADRSQLAPEPDLVERMVERALETSAGVRFVDPSTELSAADGVAAILRW